MNLEFKICIGNRDGIARSDQIYEFESIDISVDRSR